jgi:hypothetical protein
LASDFVATLKRLTPEAVGLASLTALAALLTVRTIRSGALIGNGGEDDELAREIQSQWPLLQTADSLLGFQAMLRLLIVVSASARLAGRAGTGKSSPLPGLAAAFMLFAALCRVALLALTPPEMFRLDGPVGGSLNAFFEVAAVPPLVFLALGGPRFNAGAASTRRTGVTPLGVAVAGAGLVAAVRVARHHHFALADKDVEHLDVLFALAPLLDFLAALAFLVRTLTSFFEEESALPRDADASALVAHVFLPVQQLFAAYFICTAFAKPGEAPPELVGAGQPFEVLQIAGVAQVGIYLLAGALRAAFWLDNGESGKTSSSTPVQEVELLSPPPPSPPSPTPSSHGYSAGPGVARHPLAVAV